MINPIKFNLCRSTFILLFLFSFFSIYAQIPINDSPCITNANPPYDLTGGGSHTQTTCGALGPDDPGSLPGNIADWENQTPCNNSTQDASVWYTYNPNMEDEGLDVIVNSASISNMMTVQVYTAADPSSFCNAAPLESSVVGSSCSDLSTELRISICDHTLTYFIKVTTSKDDCGEFTITAIPAQVCEYADTCEDAIDVLTTDTQLDCFPPITYITVPGCLDLACPSDISTCMADEGPTVWFKINIDSDEAALLITQIDAPGFDAVWSVYEGFDCENLELIPDQKIIDGVAQTFPCSNSDGDPGNIHQTPIDPDAVEDGMMYWVAVSAIGDIEDPYFNFNYNSTLTCLACTGESSTDCDNGDFTASILENGEWVEVDDDYAFCQGMDVQVCVEFNYNSTGSGNDWLHGFVPVFGPGWDVDDSVLAEISPIGNFEFFEANGPCAPILNGYDVANICTYVEDGVLKLCNSACDPNCPCSGGMQDGDPLPGGYWYNTPGGSPTCGTLGCSPASFYGWPGGTNVDVEVCFEIKTKVFDTIDECGENDNLRIIIQTFSDAVTGCWADSSPCISDPSLQGPSWELECNIPPSISGTDVEICHSDTLDLLVQTIDGSASAIQVDVIDNPYVTGENSYSFVGGSGFIQDTLNNITDSTQVVSYILYAIDSSLVCDGIKDTIDVTVYSEIYCTIPCIPDTVNVCRLDSGIDSTCLDFNALSAGLSGTWTQNDIIPDFNFGDFTLDSVCFEGIQTGCYSFTFSSNMEQSLCIDTISSMLVCVNPCPCPSPATQSFPDYCNINLINLEDAELSTDPGTWSVVSGPTGQDLDGIITDKLFMAVGIIPGIYVVRFTLDSPGGELCDTFSEQTINIIGQEQISVVGTGQLCNVEDQNFPTSLDLYSLINVDAGNGGSWVQSGSETMLSITEGSIISSSGVTDFSQTFTFEYTSPASGGPCPPTVTEVMVNIFDCTCPVVMVSSIDLCNESPLLDLNSLLTNEENLAGTWSTDGNLVGMSIFDPSGLAPGLYNISYTLDLSPGPDCPLVYSNTIHVFDQPKAEVIQGPYPCNADTGNGPTIINLYDWLSPGYTAGSWSQIAGDPLSLSDDGINMAMVDFSGQNIGDEFTYVFITEEAQFPCQNISVEIVIIVLDCNCPPIELSDPSPINNDIGVLDMCSLIGNSDPGTFAVYNQDGDDVSDNINSSGCEFDAAGIEAGTYTIVYTLDIQVTGNCTQSDTVLLDVLQAVSTNSLQKENIQIYPNPTFDKLHIISDYTITSLNIYTTTGISIFKTDYPNIKNVEIEMSPYSSGLYLLQINTERGRWIEKVVRK